MQKLKSLGILLILTLLLSACAVRPVNIPTPIHQPPDRHPNHAINVGLVLGSGGARGVAEAGVITALHRGGVPIDAIIGTSAGSIIGSLYSSNPNPTWLSNVVVKSQRSDMVKFDFFSMGSGMVSGYTMQRFILKHLKNGIYFRDMKIPFGIITTNFRNGKPHFINSGPVPPAVNASAAIPGIFRVVNLYGYHFVDGGVSAPIGTKKMRDFYRPKILICVSIHTDLGPNIPTSMLDKMGRAMEIVETNLEKEQFRYADIIIHPHVGEVGALAKGENQFLYNAGLKAGQKALPRIHAMMKKRGIAKRY